MKQQPRPDELTSEQATELLGISRTTLYSLIERKLLTKHTKPFGKGMGGRRIFFLRSEVEALAESKGN